jgi:hypothetical protein
MTEQLFPNFVYPLGKPMIPHLLCCSAYVIGAVDDYSFTLV